MLSACIACRARACPILRGQLSVQLASSEGQILTDDLLTDTNMNHFNSLAAKEGAILSVVL